MALTVAGTFETTGGGVVDSDVQCDATDITNVSGGSRVAVVAPVSISGAASPVEAFVVWVLNSYFQAATAENSGQALEANTRKIKFAEAGAKVEIQFQTKFELDYTDIQTVLAQNVDAYGAV